MWCHIQLSPWSNGDHAAASRPGRESPGNRAADRSAGRRGDHGIEARDRGTGSRHGIEAIDHGINDRHSRFSQVSTRYPCAAPSVAPALGASGTRRYRSSSTRTPVFDLAAARARSSAPRVGGPRDNRTCRAAAAQISVVQGAPRAAGKPQSAIQEPSGSLNRPPRTTRARSRPEIARNDGVLRQPRVPQTAATPITTAVCRTRHRRMRYFVAADRAARVEPRDPRVMRGDRGARATGLGKRCIRADSEPPGCWVCPAHTLPQVTAYQISGFVQSRAIDRS